MAKSSGCKMCGGMWIALGAMVGAGVGAMMDNIAMGAGIGAAGGLMLMLMMKMCSKGSCSVKE